jgi:DNA-3-methyladenine glycosylase II
MTTHSNHPSSILFFTLAQNINMPYLNHLTKDAKLAPVIKKTGRIELGVRKNIFLSLCYSIMSQQLSVKVADVIKKRFVALFDGKPTPGKVVQIKTETLRNIGLSNAKTNYIKNIASFALTNGLQWSKINKMSNEEFIDYVTQIKGVGKWTAEMILMFTLGREDVFSVDDYGIQQSVIKLYNLKITDKKKLRLRILSLSERWAPYRTYACMYLWRWRDTDA